MLNFIAVIVASVIYYIIIFFWYWPTLFGNTWLKLVGKEKVEKDQILRESILMIPTSLLTNFVIALLFDFLGNPDLLWGIVVVLLFYVGFVIPIAINQDLFNNRTNIKLFLIEYGDYLIAFLISGIILSLWV
ncbi:MAG: conserved membrane protein of unknown function [Promethearchaeota archaeon]|nr:MAG: conserved membrane protein of unknown function [Candidatus Lokiarchaeota archaeon]